MAKVLLRRIAMVALPACGLMGCSPEHEVNGGPAIRLDKSVTHIASPVDEGGYVDYLKAANLRHSEGITPTNNWEVALRGVFGPLENLDEASEQEYYAQLGIPKPANRPKLGEYLRVPWKFGPNFTQSDACDIKGPWTPEDYPELAEWLDKQSRQLNELVAGSQLPKYYAPYVMSSQTHANGVRATREFLDDAGKSPDALQRLASRIASKLAGGLPERPAPLSRGHASETAGQCRQLCRVLSNRVQLRIGKKDISGAWSDLLAMHRIARLLSDGMLLEWLTGGAIDGMASMRHRDLLGSGELTKEDCRRHLEDLERLPPLRSLAELLDVDVRHTALDAVQFAARKQKETLANLEASQVEIEESTRELLEAVEAVDWNRSMQVVNRKYDAYVAALREANPIRRLARTKPYGPRVIDSNWMAESKKETARAIKAGPRALSQLVGERHFDCTRIPVTVELRYQAYRAVVRAAYAARLHRLEQGAQPHSIHQLVPLLDSPPLDPFTGRPLRIRSVQHGIIVYSVGENRIDDGGMTVEDELGLDKDDIRIRIAASLK